jgi:hypothetical protein
MAPLYTGLCASQDEAVPSSIPDPIDQALPRLIVPRDQVSCPSIDSESIDPTAPREVE